MPSSPAKESGYSSAPPPYENANGDIEMNKMLEHSNTPGPGGGGGSTATRASNGKDARELRVYYTGDSRFRRRTKLEKYLMVLCLLLFVACVAFLIIALTRDSKGEC